MQQYFIPTQSSLTSGDHVELTARDSNHLVKVLRAKPRDELIITNGDLKYLARLVQPDSKEAQVEIIHKLKPSLTETELPVQVTIACGLSKNDKIEQIVQKATECGMTTFQPLAMKRDVVKWDAKKALQKIKRLEKIAQSAAEQSKRLKVPRINPLMTLADWLEDLPPHDHFLYAYEESAKQGDHQQLKAVISQLEPGQRLVILCGSEGGIDPKEVALLEAHGFLACSLGPRILRAETAPIYVLSALSYELEL